MSSQNQESYDEAPKERIIIGVGRDMTERVLTFSTPPNVNLMQPIVARLISRDRSFISVTVPLTVMEEGAHSDKSSMTFKTNSPADWVAPARVDGHELEGSAINNKTELAVESANFAITALKAAKELKT